MKCVIVSYFRILLYIKKVKARINVDSRLCLLFYLYCAFFIQTRLPFCFYGALFYLLPLK